MPFDDFDLQIQCEEYYNEDLDGYLAESREFLDLTLISDETKVDESCLPDDWSQES